MEVTRQDLWFSFRIIIENDLNNMEFVNELDTLARWDEEVEYLKKRKESVLEEVNEIILSEYSRNDPDKLEAMQRIVNIRRVEIEAIDHLINFGFTARSRKK